MASILYNLGTAVIGFLTGKNKPVADETAPVSAATVAIVDSVHSTGRRTPLPNTSHFHDESGELREMIK